MTKRREKKKGIEIDRNDKIRKLDIHKEKNGWMVGK